MPDNGRLRFHLSGDFALAGYFLMAHWPNPDTAPELDVSGGRMVLYVDTQGQGLADLKSALTALAALGGPMSVSAETWSEYLESSQRGDTLDMIAS